MPNYMTIPKDQTAWTDPSRGVDAKMIKEWMDATPANKRYVGWMGGSKGNVPAYQSLLMPAPDPLPLPAPAAPAAPAQSPSTFYMEPEPHYSMVSMPQRNVNDADPRTRRAASQAYSRQWWNAKQANKSTSEQMMADAQASEIQQRRVNTQLSVWEAMQKAKPKPVWRPEVLSLPDPETGKPVRVFTQSPNSAEIMKAERTLPERPAISEGALYYGERNEQGEPVYRAPKAKDMFEDNTPMGGSEAMATAQGEIAGLKTRAAMEGAGTKTGFPGFRSTLAEQVARKEAEFKVMYPTRNQPAAGTALGGGTAGPAAPPYQKGAARVAAEEQAAASGTVTIRSPDGTMARVPKERAQYYIGKGGTLVQ